VILHQYNQRMRNMRSFASLILVIYMVQLFLYPFGPRESSISDLTERSTRLRAIATRFSRF
jgi:hypothetical protein